MEILNTIDGSPDFIGVSLAVFCGVIAVLFLIASTSAFLDREIGSTIGAAITGILFMTVAYLGGMDSLQKSPDQYEAIITDYNEVYERGYEVVEQRGDITVLQKRESEAE